MLASAGAGHHAALVTDAAGADGAHGLPVQHLHHVLPGGLVLVQHAKAVGRLHQVCLVVGHGQRHEEHQGVGQPT